MIAMMMTGKEMKIMMMVIRMTVCDDNHQDCDGDGDFQGVVVFY